MRIRAFVLDRHSLIYVVIFKSASRSIVAACKQVHKKKNIISITDVDEKLLKYSWFTCVRNPWDRLVSCYSFAAQRKKLKAHYVIFEKSLGFDTTPSWNEFVERVLSGDPLNSNVHFRPQVHRIPNLPVRILNVESLNNDWKKLREDYPFMPPLTHENPSDHSHYSTYYTDDLAKRVGEFYKDDIDRFGYKFERE